MKATSPVYIAADNILSPLATTAADNFMALKMGKSAVAQQPASCMSPCSFYASLFKEADFANEPEAGFTKFEQLLIQSISEALQGVDIDITSPRTALIISSTKGNISLLENGSLDSNLKKRVSLHSSASQVARYFKCTGQPIVISSACISGVLALITGARLVETGQYDNVVVAGADVISKFVLSGFQSFQAVSNKACKPFDAERNGINLGEGAATIILTASKKMSKGVKIGGGAVTNDANHISGPSRSGEELFLAISQAAQRAAIRVRDVDFISAHGTATIFNDEMEAKAFALAGLQHVPVNSLKPYYGHTLGAAGILETAVSFRTMQENFILPTPGFKTLGVSKSINVCFQPETRSVNHALKTASGFGGCNAALILSKE